MKNNNYKRKSNPDNKSFTYSLNTGLAYEEPDDNFFKKDFLHDKHKNTSYTSNGFPENSQNFGTNSYNRNKKKKRKSYTFGTSVSSNSFTDHYEKPNFFTKDFSHDGHINTSYISNSFTENSQTFGTNSSKKHNGKVRRKTCSFGDSVSSNGFTDHYDKPNDNIFRKDFSHNKYRNTSYTSNEFAGKSPTFRNNNYKKNNKKRRKSYTFGDSVSSNSFTNHEHGLSKRKRKGSDQSNNVYANKKPKYNDGRNSLQNSNTYISNPEGDQLSISGDKSDGELFFFDISGNKYNSYEDALSASVKEHSIDKIDGNERWSVESSTSDSFKIPEKFKKEKIKSAENQIRIKIVEGTTIENYIDEKIMKLLTKDAVAYGEATSKVKSRKVSNISKSYVEMINPEDEDIAAGSKKPKICTKDKNFETVTDVRDGDCEMSVDDILFHKKQKKKKRKDTPALLDDPLNQEENTSKKENTTIINNSFEKSKKKKKHRETLIDIRDSDCEMSVTDVSGRKKKKKKKILEDEVPEIKENTSQEKNIDNFNNDTDHVGEISNQTTCIKSSKKSKKKNNTLVDLRNNDCEMSFSDISCRQERKERKHRQNINNAREHDSNKTTENDMASSLVSPKVFKEHNTIENLIEITNSDHDTSLNISNSKKKKKKRKSFEDVSKIKENNEDNFNIVIKRDDMGGINKDSSIFKPSKKSKKKNDTLVDIKDSDCEMNVSNRNSKKKKKRKYRENTDNEIEPDNDEETTKELNNDWSGTLGSSKKFKKYRVIETSVDIRDSDCEMTVSDASNRKKKKRKKLVGDEVPEIKENIDNFNNNIDDVGEISNQTTCIKSSKKSKKKNNTLVDLPENNDVTSILVSPKLLKEHKNIESLIEITNSHHDTNLNMSDSKKKKKKRKSIEDEVSKIEDNFNSDIKHDNVGGINKDTSIFKLSKKSKKKNHTLVDIRDSDCEMTVNDFSNRKKKKLVGDEEPEIEESTRQNENGYSFNNGYEDVRETIPSSKSPKKSKEKNSTLINPDCDTSFTDVLCNKKKEKHREYSNYNIEHDAGEKSNKELTNDMTNALACPKKLKKQKHVEPLIDIRDSDFEMSVNEIPRRKKNKKKKLSIEAEVPEIEERTLKNENIVNSNNTDDMGETNMESNSLSSSKTSEKNNTLVDLRDSECEMIINDVPYHKKKKKKNKHRENTSNDIEHYSDEKITKEQDSDIPSNLMSPKRLKKHKGSEPLVDIRDGNCEISVTRKKNKKKKISIDAEVPEIKEGTPQKENIDNFKNTDVKETNMEASSLSSPKTSEKNNALTEIVITPDFPNYRSQISEIDTSPQSRFPENSLENLNDCKQGIDISTTNVDNTKNNNRIYTSSSEGYQSDSSEIISPIKHKELSIGDEDEVNFTGEDKKLLNLISENCASEEGEDEFDVSQKMNNSKDDVENTEGNSREEDISPKSSQWKLKKSTFVKKLEEHLDGDAKTTSRSDRLEIPNMVKEKASEDDLETVLGLDILCSFRVCDLHSILRRPSKPTKKELEEIKNLKLEVKTGAFSREEDAIILNNWKTFCEEYNLTVNPSLFISFPRKVKMENKSNFLRYLARGLDNRLLHRVHERFKNLLERPSRKIGRFTAEEDKTILDYMSQTRSRTPMSDLAEILNRTRVSICKRYELLTSKKNPTRVRWTPEMVDIFLSHMKKVTKCDNVENLKHRKLTEKEWRKLSKKMDDIPVKKLQRGWRITIYPRLFAKDVNSEVFKAIKEDLIDNLYERGETDWKTVNWKEIAEEYDGFTPEKIYNMFKHTVSYHVPEASRENLKECLDFLENKVLKYGQLGITNKFQKFVYEEGHIVDIIYD